MNGPALPAQSTEAQRTRGRLMVLAAAVLWSSSGLFAKAPLFDDWPVETKGTLLAFWRALFAGLVLLPCVRGPRFRAAMLPMILFFVAMSVTYLSAMTQTTAANAIWLQSTAPFWVFLFSLGLGLERPTRGELVPLVFGCAGVAAILFNEVHATDRMGVGYGLAAGVCYAGVVLALRALRDEPSVWLVTLNHLSAAALLLPVVVSRGVMPDAQQFAVLFAFGVLQMGVPYVLLARGLQHVPPQEAIVIGLVEPILLPLWVFLVWKEAPSQWTIIGGACILIALVLRYGWLLAYGPPQDRVPPITSE